MIPRTVNIFELLVLLICLLTVACKSLSYAVDEVGLSGAASNERLNIINDSEVTLEKVNINEQWLETTNIEMNKGLVELIDEKEDSSTYEPTMSRKEPSLYSTDIDTGSSESPRDIQISVDSTDTDSSVASTDIEISVASTDIEVSVAPRDIDSIIAPRVIDISVGSRDIEISIASTDINISVSPGDIDSSVGSREIDSTMAPTDIEISADIECSRVVSGDLDSSVAPTDINTHASPRDIDIKVAPTEEEMIDSKPLSINDRNGFVLSLIRDLPASIAAFFRRLMLTLRRLFS